MYSKTIAVGRITKDPQFKAYTSGNGELALFSIAVNRAKDKTDFYDCVAFGKTAEMVKNYLSNGKGRLILVEGTFQNNNSNREVKGVEVTNYGMNLAVDVIKFLDSPTKSSTQSPQAPQQAQASYQQAPQQAPQQQQRPAYSQPTTSPSFQNPPAQQHQQQAAPTNDPFATAPGFGGFDMSDDDLPF